MPLDPPLSAIPTVGQAPVMPEKLISKMFRESWFAILMWTITFAFTLGMTYASITGQVAANTSRIEGMQQLESVNRTELLNQIQMNKQDVIDRMNQIDKKLDDINKYLRDHK